jgi:DNA-binding response OmpR family regulator
VSEGDIIAYSKDILNLFNGYAKSKNVKLTFSSIDKRQKVYFDRDKIEKILYNLLSNAISYTPDGGAVNLSISKIKSIDSKRVISIIVKDSGKGIPEDQINFIFDRFYQIEKNTESEKISTGIGLSLVKSLVKIHKGEVNVFSEINKGTEFIVHLPINKEYFELNEILSSQDIEPSYNYSKSMLSLSDEEKLENSTVKIEEEKEVKIVIVEDNKDLNKFLVNELKDEYQVLTAFDGKEGMELINEHLPNIVISDIMMPVMDGIALCKEVKNNINTSHIPVFLLTAKSEQEHQLSGLDVGADDYITKPFQIETLKLRILNTINVRKTILEKFSSNLKPIPEGIKISTLDHNLLENIISYVENNIDADITGDILASELGLSKSNLYKKLKDLTGISVNIYIRNIRLNIAAQLLKRDNYNISEVAYAVGFNNPKYFSSCFREYYNKSPRVYMRN